MSGIASTTCQGNEADANMSVTVNATLIYEAAGDDDVSKVSSPSEDTECHAYSSRGRKRKTRLVEAPDSTKKSRPSNDKKKKSKETGDPEQDFAKHWICTECKEAECALDPAADQLLICEGLCRRLFHYPCVNLRAVPPDDVPFHCFDCTNGRHRCAVCQDYGTDDEDVFKCRRDECGFFFHEGCLAVRNIAVTYQGSSATEQDAHATQDDDDEMDGPKATDKPLFDCPAHRCWTCSDNIQQNDSEESQGGTTAKPKKKGSKSSGATEAKRGELYCCIECPTSYHISCIPPTARFHELALLCHDHAASCKLPDLDEETSMQNAIENKVTKLFSDRAKSAQRKKRGGQNPFLVGLSGGQLTTEETAFAKEAETQLGQRHEIAYCLPVAMKDEVFAMPPTYRHIHVNKVDPNHAPPRFPVGDPCVCEESCGVDCYNRLTYTECTSKNCNVGASCGNRMMSKRKVPKCKVRREPGKGWGLLVLEAVKKGDLVQEYIGEIIDEVEKEKRLSLWSVMHPNDPNFYIMANAPGWFIDARFTSNLSRFINHSCDPNCLLSAVNVNGIMRNGIYALRDLEAGEFLSYDYHFDTNQKDRFTCRCGAPKCRGTMKYIVQRKEEVQNKSKGQVWDEARGNYERDRKFVDDYNKDNEERLSQVAVTVPDSSSNDELVANGPQPQKFRAEAQRGRIFLWRNAELGSDFVARTIRVDKRSSTN